MNRKIKYYSVVVLALIIGTLISACSVPLGSNPYAHTKGCWRIVVRETT